MNEDKRTMLDLARNAIDVQSACNLSGVVHSFSRDISRLRALLEGERGFGTDMINKHPVCILYASKISDLTWANYSSEYSVAYRWAQDIVSAAHIA